MTSLNANLSIPVGVDTEQMDWSPSPSGTVWRKRVFLAGAAESGRVTSVVRYEPNASFPIHDHPDGEEILVLDGVFSDDHGDWPAGTYLLNPEGFRHAPRSEGGCLLFVKLRQFAGRGRDHVAIQTDSLPWQGGHVAGVEEKPLYADPAFPERIRIEAWTPARVEAADYQDGVEIFLLSGRFRDELGEHGPGSWLRLPAGSRHAPRIEERCEVYLREGGFDSLEP